MTPTRYRNKPSLVEAVQWNGSIEHADLIERWTGGLTACHGVPTEKPSENGAGLVKTVQLVLYFWADPADPRGQLWHGTTVRVNDWILKDVQGRFYPCRDDVFTVLYEPDTTNAPPAEREGHNNLTGQLAADDAERLHAPVEAAKDAGGYPHDGVVDGPHHPALDAGPHG